jgi:alpha-1,3-rhamnosyltransferase
MANAVLSETDRTHSVFVVVPSYNHAPFVERCLRSIFRQTLKPIKLLVIDDGSTDGSPDVIRQTLNDCPFASDFMVRENKGLCRTLNEALDLSEGDFFSYISSDDIWLPEFLESRIRTMMDRPNAILSYGHSYVIDEQDRIFDSNENWGDYVDGNATKMLLGAAIPASASVVYRRRALLSHRWHENAALEDYDLYLRLSLEGEFALDDRILSGWRIHGSNTSRDSGLMLDEWLNAQDRLIDELGLSRGELDHIQRKVKFDAISNLARNGQRDRATELLFETAGDLPIGSVLQKLIRIAAPDSAYRLWHLFRNKRMKKKFGRIKT